MVTDIRSTWKLYRDSCIYIWGK